MEPLGHKSPHLSPQSAKPTLRETALSHHYAALLVSGSGSAPAALLATLLTYLKRSRVVQAPFCALSVISSPSRPACCRRCAMCYGTVSELAICAICHAALRMLVLSSHAQSAWLVSLVAFAARAVMLLALLVRSAPFAASLTTSALTWPKRDGLLLATPSASPLSHSLIDSVPTGMSKELNLLSPRL